MRKVIIVDLDGTLCNHNPRVHHAYEGDWEEYHNGIKDDEPHLDVLDFLNTALFKYEIVALTGRMEMNRLVTNHWLMKYKVPIDELIMRKDNDFRPAQQVKISLLEERYGSKEKVLEKVAFVLEDTTKVVEALREYGLNVWQVRNG